jgi:hypothetical protein
VIRPWDFLRLAEDLVDLDPRRPRQAALRRAVSTAYYALFHLLVREAVEGSMGFRPTETHREIGEAAVRWFEHRRMADACFLFAAPVVRGKLAKALPKSVVSAPVSDALQAVARAFLDLQEARHLADYDPSSRTTRQHARNLVTRARQAFDDWQTAASDPFRSLFLVMLLTGDGVVKER